MVDTDVLSDGQKDGVLMFYMMDKTLYPLVLNAEQVTKLDIFFKASVGKLRVLEDMPMDIGEVSNLAK